MHNSAHSHDLQVPETVGGLSVGEIPAYNQFLASGSFRDLSNLLRHSNASPATNINIAATGTFPGLVYNGKPSTLVSEVMFAELQIEAQHKAAHHEECEKTHRKIHAHEQEKTASHSDAFEESMNDLVKGESPVAKLSGMMQKLGASDEGEHAMEQTWGGDARLSALGAKLNSFMGDMVSFSTGAHFLQTAPLLSPVMQAPGARQMAFAA